MRFKAIIITLFLFIAVSWGNAQKTEDFKTFLNKFTTSASFQYERVKFPLASPILLVTDDGEEKEFQFTREKWPLLDNESFREERVSQEEGGIYVARFVLNEPVRKEFEAGYEESELDLRVVFEQIEGKWYVTDCYNGWYSFDLPPGELDDTVKQVQELNAEFEELHP